MLSQQEISDRLEVMDLLARYSVAVDRQAWDDLDALFTEDAHLDYTATGGIAGSLQEHKEFNARVLSRFGGTQHLMGLPVVQVDGDTATCRTPCYNPLVVDGSHVFFVGLWYDDELVRTSSGWRFARRTEQQAFRHDPGRART